MKALLAGSMLTFHRVNAKTIEVYMLNDNWIYVLIGRSAWTM